MTRQTGAASVGAISTQNSSTWTGALMSQVRLWERRFWRAEEPALTIVLTNYTACMAQMFMKQLYIQQVNHQYAIIRQNYTL
jgi:hypothetical protein